MKNRKIDLVVPAQATSDGAGVRLKRTLGTSLLRHFDPFLMLDEFRSDDPNDYIAGFPDHPHRGFETVTIMLAGAMQHRDSVGNTGNLGPGSVQWMTAGRGIIHSEMPQQVDGLMWGFQLWVNLPAKEKMTAPRYQDIPAARIPVVEADGVQIRVIAGHFQDTVGPVGGVATEPRVYDATLSASVSWEIPAPASHRVFVYVYQGEVDFSGTRVHSGNLVTFKSGDQIQAVSSEEGARCLICAGKPLGEPIVQYGPFVMNTRGEIISAFDDFRTGKFI